MNLQLDVRPLLPTVSVPIVVLHNTHDTVSDVGNARFLAAHVPGANHLPPFTHAVAVAAQIEAHIETDSAPRALSAA